MMPVARRAEPEDFDRKVRQPGMQWLREKLGAERTPRPGAPVIPLAPGQQLSSRELKDYWTACLPDLHRAHDGVCSYTGLAIREGGGTVDHFECKDRCLADEAKRGLIYDWTNFRYAFLRVNQHRGNREVLDPFNVRPDWFKLDFTTLAVHPRDHIPEPTVGLVRDTIRVAGLNGAWLVRLRTDYFEDWMTGETTLDYLRKYAPFIAAEIHRQGITQG